MNYFSFLLFSALTIFCSATADDTLVSVAIILRHGARTMNNPEFFDITNVTWLKKNNGALTPVGKRMHYLAGRELRKRYQHLLDKENPTQSVLFLSSGLNRTIESLEALSFGMFGNGTLEVTEKQEKAVKPPIDVKNIDKIRSELNKFALPDYQRPVPIHSRMDVKDYMYDPHSNCPGFKASVNDYRQETDKLEKEFEPFFNKIQNDKNLPINIRKQVVSTYHCYKFADNIQVVEGNGEVLNFKFDAELKAQLFNCSLGNSLRNFLVGGFRPKIVSHYPMRNVADLFALAKSGTTSKRKIGVYLMSDAHIMAIHRLLSWDLKKYVKYASSLIFEMHRNVTTGKCYVKAIYDDVAKDEKVDLDEFLKFVNDNTFKSDKEFMDACLIVRGKDDYDKSLYLIIALVFFGALLIIWGVSWFCVLWRRRKRVGEAETALTLYT
eukprot:TRINITY_DN1762_c0_g2_i1.p1 TRINITY_DN1762_c0_g2~~TRINITY_DN1762_c0_g2_i1.p1  ORF type:complete len:438 (-),score=97.88 TRINITY_DN1762_c0_g2_i1:167-1480(-)